MCVWIAFILLVLACITPSAASLPPTELIVTETLEPDLPSTSAATIEVTPTDCPATLCAPDMVMPPTIDKTLTPTSESDRVWSEGPLGADRLTIKFYSNPKGARCVSLTSQTTSGRQIASIGGCPTTKATDFGIRANIADSTG